MAATNDNGNTNLWLDGEPIKGIRNSAAATGQENLWIDGEPVVYLFAPTDSGLGWFLFTGGLF